MARSLVTGSALPLSLTPFETLLRPTPWAMQVVQPTDRGPLMHWLVHTATPEQRELCNTVLSSVCALQRERKLKAKWLRKTKQQVSPVEDMEALQVSSGSPSVAASSKSVRPIQWMMPEATDNSRAEELEPAPRAISILPAPRRVKTRRKTRAGQAPLFRSGRG